MSDPVRFHGVRAALCLAALCSGLACVSPERSTVPAEPEAEPHAAPVEQPPAPPVDRSSIAGYSVEGRPIHYSVHGTGSQTALILASIHGDEAAGTPLLEALAEHLDEHPAWTARARVVIVPDLNPDGRAARTRTNSRGVDLNRNFPAANSRSAPDALSEPESAALAELLERYTPDRVLSIHGWIGLMDWDGPAEALARSTAEHCALPARQIGARPGSLGSFVGVDKGIPILTLEMPSSARRLEQEALWEQYGDALLSFIRPPPATGS